MRQLRGPARRRERAPAAGDVQRMAQHQVGRPRRPAQRRVWWIVAATSPGAPSADRQRAAGRELWRAADDVHADHAVGGGVGDDPREARAPGVPARPDAASGRWRPRAAGRRACASLSPD
jgi:hypothetical protein